MIRKGAARGRRTNERELAFTHLAEYYRDRAGEVDAPRDLKAAMQGQPQVSAGLKEAPGGIESVLNALRAFDNPQAQAFISLYDSLTKTDRKHVTLEEIAVAADVGTSRLLGVAVEALAAYGRSVSQIILWAGMPKLVKKSMQVAATGRGGDDRDRLFKAAAFVPIPKGSSVAVQVNNQLPAKPEDQPWDPENQLRGIHEAWGETKALPSPEHELSPTLETLQDETTEFLDAE